jgi:hypothetical protein
MFKDPPKPSAQALKSLPQGRSRAQDNPRGNRRNHRERRRPRASNALILGFNVRANMQASDRISPDNIQIKYCSVICDLTEEVKALLSGVLTPEIPEHFPGTACSLKSEIRRGSFSSAKKSVILARQQQIVPPGKK